MRGDLAKHYGLLLGLDSSWRVEAVRLELESKRVDISLEYVGSELTCPDCGSGCPRHDFAPERTWRHLDTMQFETLIRARPPRSKCRRCGVKTCEAPWAGKHSRYTLLFEAFVIEALQACGNVNAACELLGLDWDAVNSIMERAVQRGLACRETEGLKHLGLDEKSFGRGHDYVSVMTDIDGGRVLEVSRGREQSSVDELWQTLTFRQREGIEAVAMDMWQAYISSTEKNAAQASRVFDRFHISKHLNEGVDRVRREENKALKKAGDETLVGSRQLWLFNPENLSQEQRVDFRKLQKLSLRTARAWAIKEQFRHFWNYTYVGSADKFFKKWYGWARRSRLKPMMEKAKMMKSHLEGLMSYFRHRITNAMAEGFNSKIQQLKHSARGFRKFENYRTRILFYCGKLDLLPPLPSH